MPYACQCLIDVADYGGVFPLEDGPRGSWISCGPLFVTDRPHRRLRLGHTGGMDHASATRCGRMPGAFTSSQLYGIGYRRRAATVK